jgi:DNA-binding transcriptional LysR family regulator
VEIRQLEHFIAVMSAGSITGAARMLGRSQPAVTRTIKELETEIGFLLLHRKGPRVTPTDRGLRFHEEVERLWSGLSHLKERADAIAAQETPSIEIAGIPALAGSIIPQAIARLGAAVLPRQIHLRSLSAEGVLQSVIARSSDIGLSSFPLEHTGIEINTVAEAPCVVAVPSDHLLATRDIISLGDFNGQRVVAMANPYRQRRRVDLLLERAGVLPMQVIDTNTSINALQLVRAGLGIAILEPVAAYCTQLTGVEIRPLDAHLPFLWAVVSALGRPRSLFLSRLIVALDDLSADLIPGHRIIDVKTANGLLAHPIGDRDTATTDRELAP